MVVKDVVKAAQTVLNCADADEKANLTEKYVGDWRNGRLLLPDPDKEYDIPDCPARPSYVKMVPMSKVKQGSQKALMHSLAHAESYAIDLMWDIVARFTKYGMPREFFDDWIQIAGDEAKHYFKWQEKLKRFGSFYGDLAGHNSLWESAQETSDDLMKRLAIVHMVHEARGLDVYEGILQKLKRCRDPESMEILKQNHAEEITHVAAGVRWFKYLCAKKNVDPVQQFHEIVKNKFHGSLKPPFNKASRERADLTEDFYIPLSSS